MPAIIYIHGGAWMQGDRTVNRNAFLAEHGFFTISIDYRSSLQAVFPAQLDDVKAAVRWLREHAAEYRIDPWRIGVWGHSAGAHLAALVGTSGHIPALGQLIPPDELSSQVQAVATLACPTDFSRMGGWHEAADSPEARLIGGPIRERPDVVRMANPITETLYVTGRACNRRGSPHALPWVHDVCPTGRAAVPAHPRRARRDRARVVIGAPGRRLARGRFCRDHDLDIRRGARLWRR